MVVYFRKIVERVERHRKLAVLQAVIADYGAEQRRFRERVGQRCAGREG
jgi:hypothetical protein